MKILAVSGSLRALSFNTKLLRLAVAAAQKVGATVTHINLRDYPLPIYDADLVARDGIPQPAADLRRNFEGHQGLIVASPEYNGSVTALLKNSLDWSSAPVFGQDALMPFRGKPAAILAASPSPFGGIRSAGHLRAILSKMSMHVMPDEVLVPAAGKAFAADDSLLDAATAGLLDALCGKLVKECILRSERVAS